MTVALAQCTAEDEYMPRPGDIDIGLKNDQIMQRYLVRRIFREVEFRVKDDDGEWITGFITGFDDRCLQMSTSPAHEADAPHSELIFWPIRRIAETGRTLADLDHESRSKIRSYSHALRAQCEQYLTAKAPAQQRPPRRLESAPTESEQLFSEP